MAWKRVLAYSFLVVVLAFALLPSVAFCSVTVNTNNYFSCGSGSYVSFDETKTFNAVNKTFQTSGWYFDNYGFEATNCNITVTDLFVANSKAVYMTLRSTSDGVASVKFEDGNRVSQPASVSNVALWSYSTVDNSVSFTNSLTANTNYIVVVSWDAAGGGGGSGEDDNPTPTPSPSPTPPPFKLPDFTPGDMGTAIIIVIVVAAGFLVALLLISAQPNRSQRKRSNGKSGLGSKKQKRGKIL